MRVTHANHRLRYGERLVDMYNSYRNATSEIKERILSMKMTWLKIETQLKYLQEIETIQTEQHKALQRETLGVLQVKLQAAMDQLQKLGKKRDGDTINEASEGKAQEKQYKQWKYPLIKKSLDAAISELQAWQQTFDPTWFLTLRMSNPEIDANLKEFKEESLKTGGAETHDKRKIMSTAKNVRDCLRMDPQSGPTMFFRTEETVDWVYTAIPYSTASICERSSKSQLIADSVPATPDIGLNIQSRDVRDLARKLANTDPISFGLLKCRGVARVYREINGPLKAFDFHFHIPSSLHSPQSLRNVLIESKPSMSLSVRFLLAQQLARSLSYVHMYEFVHKGIRPETVLIFDSGKTELAHSFLLGFEKFRADAGRTLKTSDSVWERDLYRHPERQGEKPEEAYKMQHDIYSLGVCLLEIGMWRTLVTYNSVKGQPTPSQLLPPPDYSEKDEVGKARSLKDTLIGLAQRELPSCMGDKYTGIVTSCLTCLDKTNPDFSDENDFKDEDDVIVGVRYIQKVSD